MQQQYQTEPKASLWVIFLIAFLDLFGFGLIIPIFAPLFIDETRSVLDAATSENTRNLLYGLILGGFSLCQFLGAPVMGSVH